MEAKILPVAFCFFSHFGRLLPAAVYSADSQLICHETQTTKPSTDSRFDSEVKWWIHFLSIVTYLRKNSFFMPWNRYKQCSDSSTHCCFWLTVSKHANYFEHSFLIDVCSWKMIEILSSDIFKSTAIKDRTKQIGGVFWCLPRWLERTASCVCTTAFKLSMPPFNRCPQRSRVQITLIKPLLCLNRIFPSESNALSTQEIFRLFW